MPYITKKQREKLDSKIDALSRKLIEKKDVGEYNYVITRLIHDYIRSNGVRYKHLNNAVGILECAKLEFVRMVVSNYEDKKIEENGNISELDKL